MSKLDAETLYCYTCKSKIDFDPARVVIFEKNNFSITIYFHYFFPCWDFDYIIQEFPDCSIKQAGFSFEDKSMSPQGIMNMKRNTDLWL